MCGVSTLCVSGDSQVVVYDFARRHMCALPCLAFDAMQYDRIVVVITSSYDYAGCWQHHAIATRRCNNYCASVDLRRYVSFPSVSGWPGPKRNVTKAYDMPSTRLDLGALFATNGTE